MDVRHNLGMPASGHATCAVEASQSAAESQYSLKNGSITGSPTNLLIRGPSGPDSHYWFVDTNGDGLADALSPSTGAAPAIHMTTGSGFALPFTRGTPPGAPVGPTMDADSSVTSFDYDQDGRPDILVFNDDEPTAGYLSLRLGGVGALSVASRLHTVPARR